MENNKTVKININDVVRVPRTRGTFTMLSCHGKVLDIIDDKYAIVLITYGKSRFKRPYKLSDIEKTKK